MTDYEVKDVMNRATLPDVDVEFSYDDTYAIQFDRQYGLNIVVRNRGDQVVKDFKLHFTFPSFGDQVTLRQKFDPGDPYHEFYDVGQNTDEGNYQIVFRSK